MNSITLTGRLAKEPDIRQIQGKAGPVMTAGFPLVVKRNHTDKVFAVMVSAYGPAATFAEKYLHKGMRIMISGELNVTSYEKDETTYYYTVVIMDTVEFCEPKKENRPGIDDNPFLNSDRNDNPFEDYTE